MASVLRAAQPRLVRWLCGDHADRARFVAVYSRFSSLPIYGAAMGGTVLLNALWYGWILVVLNVVALVTMLSAVSLARRVERAEIVAASAFALLQTNLAVSVAVSGGGLSPLLPLMAVPVISQAVCFRPTVTTTGVGLSAVLAVGASLIAPVPDHPAPAFVHLIAYLTLLVCASTAVRQLVNAEMSSRDAAVLDPLTGLFNRRALDDRFRTARAQAGVTGETVSLILCDIDRFKTVNDNHGHERGDRVLVAIAEQLRACVRNAEMVYRLGGEEFLVLLPNEGVESAGRLAERIRSSVGTDPVVGLRVTLSAGVAAASGDAVRLDRLLAEADAALYEAKRSGRDRVALAAVPTQGGLREGRRSISGGPRGGSR
jgi:diguanylate cyclase (GGDEF)-like protein